MKQMEEVDRMQDLLEELEGKEALYDELMQYLSYDVKEDFLAFYNRIHGIEEETTLEERF